MTKWLKFNNRDKILKANRVEQRSEQLSIFNKKYCKQEDDRMASFDTCQATILHPDKIFFKNEKKDISRQTKLRELKLAALHNNKCFLKSVCVEEK